MIGFQNAASEAAKIVASGGVIAYLTDTFYGLGVDPFNPLAIEKVKSLKGRDERKPILVLISDLQEIDRFISERSEAFEILSAEHWPGALTIVAGASAEVPDELTAGTKTIGLRLPDDEPLREFVRACGGALTATSANPSGSSPARTALEVANYFSTDVGLIVDGGEAQSDAPSTVLDVSGAIPRLIREGVVSREELERTLRDIGLK